MDFFPGGGFWSCVDFFIPGGEISDNILDNSIVTDRKYWDKNSEIQLVNILQRYKQKNI